jgi:hypothetical protein
MGLIIHILLGTANTILRGVVIKYFWGWFILTVFHTLPDLSLAGAIGLSLVLEAISPWKTLSRRELTEFAEAAEDLSVGAHNAFLYAIGLVISFVVGWVIHLLM